MATSALVAAALLVPAVGRSDVDHSAPATPPPTAPAASGSSVRGVLPAPTHPARPAIAELSSLAPASMSWTGAGAFVWHETDVAPETLGVQLRENGFSWVAVLTHDGLTVDPIEDDWVQRFRAASRLPVGAWGVLRTRPKQEAELAHELLVDHSLDFYIANAEAEYKFTGDDGTSRERFERSQTFVERFRELEPDTLAAVSSYCRADRQDLDWGAWRTSRFVFLPQAYVNDFGRAASPVACARGASEFFGAEEVHPTVGVYTGQQGEPSPERYAELLDEAGTVGFSVYLAETAMHGPQWHTFGTAIAERGIARTTANGSPKRADLRTRHRD